MKVENQDREKRYILVEFPYPSGSGLHMGHAFSFTGGDVYARFCRMRGYTVLFPMGWDAFGLPTENYAIRTGRPPAEVTRENTALFRRQMDELALSFDWDREVDTTDPGYYRFTQWIFLQLVKHDLAYRAEMPINWCPSCRVGLANEEVVDGCCERCGAATTRRRVSQWVVRITAYADRLLEGLEETDFEPKVKAAQANWIGKSQGARITFQVDGLVERPAGGSGDPTASPADRPSAGRTPADGVRRLDVFTTRPDTLWGVTFIVVAPEHPLVEAVLAGSGGSGSDQHADAAVRARVREYVRRAARASDLERTSADRAKSGVPIGLHAINPATGERVPIWVGDFVLGSYGTGAVMGVPAHDERDHAFAAAHGLRVVPEGPLQGIAAEDAVAAAVAWLEAHGCGTASASWHLRDWIFSRQHYWGEPIPMVHCDQCGWVAVPEDELPVELPEVVAYQPTETGESPLAAIEDWVTTTCPTCGGPARRETDTMPNWAGSNWYFLRFCDPTNRDGIASMEALREWMPVDVYVGGDEHNTLHLLYSRFIYHFLHDIGVVPPEIPEPYRVRLSHGVILGPDGQRMSKSRGNVIVPDEYVRRYGADAVRLYLMFMGPFSATMAWNDRAHLGVRRFLNRLERLASRAGAHDAGPHTAPGSLAEARATVDETIARVTRDVERFHFNTAVAALMECANALETARPGRDQVELLRTVALLLAPLAPATAQRIWRGIGADGCVHDAPWPEAAGDPRSASAVTLSVQVNGKLRGTVEIDPDLPEEEIVARARSAGTVASHIGGKPVRRVVYVAGRAVNFVV